jgi:hypothetical protein
MNTSMYGSSIAELGLQTANQIGTISTGAFTNVPYTDGKYSRRLVQNLWGGWRQQAGYIHLVPDGSFATFDSCVADPHLLQNGGQSRDQYGCQVFLAKWLPQPPNDGIDRTNFETVSIPVSSASGATQARLKWGYLENEQRSVTDSIAWPPATHFYCTQYQGTCYWNGSAASPSFSSSTFTALALNRTVNLQIGVPQRVMFYQVEYLNSSNQVIATDPVQAAATP